MKKFTKTCINHKCKKEFETNRREKIACTKKCVLDYNRHKRQILRLRERKFTINMILEEMSIGLHDYRILSRLIQVRERRDMEKRLRKYKTRQAIHYNWNEPKIKTLGKIGIKPEWKLPIPATWNDTHQTIGEYYDEMQNNLTKK